MFLYTNRLQDVVVIAYGQYNIVRLLMSFLNIRKVCTAIKKPSDILA
jgi:hypothetical protein